MALLRLRDARGLEESPGDTVTLPPVKLYTKWPINGGPYGSVVMGPGGEVKVFASMSGGMRLYETLDLEKWKDCGIVLAGAYESCIFYDPSTRRYRCLASIRGQGMMSSESVDGRQWSPWDGPWLKRACDSNGSVLFDIETGRYVLYLRAWRKTDQAWLRVVVRASVSSFADLLQYTPLPHEASGSPFLDLSELHPIKTPVAWPFHVVADAPEGADWYTWPVAKIGRDWLAFPSLYTHTERTHVLSEGTTEIMVAESRDGQSWNVLQTPYVPRGDVREVDCGCLYLYNGYVQDGDTIWQLYYGNNRTHTHLKVLQKGATESAGGLFVVKNKLGRFRWAT